ncbi:DUF4044 domain-containing protein [Fructobacillus sp. M1-13]|uniref:DUF4044 domain-containing protein n=1 Tax=Fructobacillus papyriferae TaxID=2713171 RepID=A0ABS5QN47_9LACO|nr:DUF4044 domain-containing protein [Fructobacillus papyriferae]MBS9334495.1 DUF4044 domain-containing protein [Fructobacillus papyriferae]MCD2158484.1 DUF4044 domain-containing protein [Fructobacillus papyriferae]
MFKKKQVKAEESRPVAPTVDKALEDEVNRQLAKKPMPTFEKKKKTRYQKWTLFMSLFMVIVMAGSVIYAAISAIH